MKQDLQKDNDPRFRFKQVDEKHSVFNRKNKRKEKREASKKYKVQFFSQKSNMKVQDQFIQKQNADKQMQNTNKKQKPIQKDTLQNYKKQLPTQQKIKEPEPIKNTQVNSQLEKLIQQDELEIQLLEKKLGISSKRKQKKVFEETGLDNKFFDFLSNIHKSIKLDPSEYQPKNLDDDESNQSGSLEQESGDDFFVNSKDDSIDKQYEENHDGESKNEQPMSEELSEQGNDDFQFDDQDYNSEDYEKLSSEEFIVDDEDLIEEGEQLISQTKQPKKDKNIEDVKTEKKQEIKKIQQKEEEQSQEELSRALQVCDPQLTLELQKKINACFNRLSENNLELIFNQINGIFQENPKSVTGELISNIYLKFNMEAQNALQFIIACNTALISAIHQIYDNDFFQVVIQKIMKKVPSLDHKQIQNLCNIISLFYIFDSITLDFIKSFINYLLSIYDEVYTLEYILIIFQNTGMKIRSDNPKVLKDLIQQVVDGTGQKKKDSSKEKFLLDTLQDIKMNKKVKGDPTERLEFLRNFIKKGLIQKNKIPQKQFTLDFEFCLNADFSKRNWWQPLDFQNYSHEKNKQIVYNSDQQTFLEKKAIEQKFTTHTRKQIFVTLMSSLDYLDATQKLLKLAIPKNQQREIAIVITDCCGQESKFNQFYAFVAQKMIEIDKQHKFSFQYCIWDHLKLLKNYSNQKIQNLSQFTEFLISKGVHNLGLIKVLEFQKCDDQQKSFTKILIKNLLEQQNILISNDNQKITEICTRIKQNDDLMIFRDNLSDFIKQKLSKQFCENEVIILNKELKIKCKLLLKNLEINF